MKIEGREIYLNLLSPENVTQAYVDWMQDQEVTQFLESRWNVYTVQNLQEYVRKVNTGSQNFLFGIFLKEPLEHIGNIKIGDVHPIHRFADVGLIIGNKQVWGKGYGTEAIALATEYAFVELNLHKLFAGIYENNIGSYKAFLKAGYREVGRFKAHRFYQGRYVDEILVENIRLQ